MTNPYYNPSGVPVTRAQLSSASMRTELAAIGTGFEKLAPTLTANALLHVNAAGTQQVAHSSITVSAAGALAGITDLTTTGNTVLGNATTDTLNVGNGGIVKDASGNVGIGTASPAQKLHVAGSIQLASGSNLQWTAYSAGVTGELFYGTALVGLVGITAGVERFRVDTSGNLGLGTASPAGRLHVKTTSTTIPVVLDTSADTAPSYTQHRVNSSTGWEVGMSQSSEGYDYRWCYGTFGTSNNRLRLDSSGNLIQRLQGAVPTMNNQEAVMTFPDNSTLRLTFKGTDGTERYVDLPLTT